MLKRFGGHIAVAVLAVTGLTVEIAAAEPGEGVERREVTRSQALEAGQEVARVMRLERNPAAAREQGAKRAERRKGRRARSVPKAPAVPKGVLDSIAACESGGNPRAIGGGGAYRGKYQFDRGTWASVGGSGDPAAAPEAEQDARAAILYSRTGGSAWPNCA